MLPPEFRSVLVVILTFIVLVIITPVVGVADPKAAPDPTQHGTEASEFSKELPPSSEEASPKGTSTSTEGTSEDISSTDTADTKAERTSLNLLGEVDTASGESRRNENVNLTLIDNNVLKEINKRMGTTATIVRSFDIEKGYFGSEFGASPSRPNHLSARGSTGFHGSVYESHGNSIFSARSFFQVGAVKPARSNDYGFQVGIPVWSGANFFVSANQQRNRGSVK